MPLYLGQATGQRPVFQRRLHRIGTQSPHEFVFVVICFGDGALLFGESQTLAEVEFFREGGFSAQIVRQSLFERPPVLDVPFLLGCQTPAVPITRQQGLSGEETRGRRDRSAICPGSLRAP